MAKLSRQQRAHHAEAETRLAKDHLTDDDADFILANWHPAADHNIGATGAFFTPPELASDFRIEVAGDRILDLCAGIGNLSLYASRWPYNRDSAPDVTCIEINPRFVEIGRKLLPQATWICGNAFDLPRLIEEHDLGPFDCIYANPPFGKVSRGPDERDRLADGHELKGPRYRGPEFEYHLIDLASDYADYGVFLLPQMSSPFAYSGERYFQWRKSTACQRFEKLTRLEGQGGCGIDTSVFRDQWQMTNPATEIVTFDFTEAREARKTVFSTAPLPSASDEPDARASRPVRLIPPADPLRPEPAAMTDDDCQEAIAILRATNDGDDLTTYHLRLLEAAVNGFINDVGRTRFAELKANVNKPEGYTATDAPHPTASVKE